MPLLAWEPPPLSSNMLASEVMSYPVVVLPTVVKVSKLVDILSSETYCGFPVVDRVNDGSSQSSVCIYMIYCTVFSMLGCYFNYIHIIAVTA